MKEKTQNPRQIKKYGISYKNYKDPSITSFKIEVDQAKGMEKRLSDVETLLTSSGKRTSTLEELMKEQDLKTRILTNIIIRQEEEINSIKHQLVLACRRDIRNNIVISGLAENAEETKAECEGKVEIFFKNTMEIKDGIAIDSAWRLGRKGSGDQPVLAKLKDVTEKATIFSNVKSLKGKRNARKKLYFINDDLDPPSAEEKQKFRELMAENKQLDDDKKMTIKFKRNRIEVNQEIITSKIYSATAAEILRMSDQDRQDIKVVKQLAVGEHSE